MIKIFEKEQELAAAFCDELIKLSRGKGKFNIALSGGSTPKIIFQEIVNNYKTKFNWNKIHLFWGDERCVPPDDDESNFGMTKKYLLDFINIPNENIHRIKGEDDPETEVKRYSEEIIKNVNSKNRLPGFDLIILGLGEDGHTASIFPDQMFVLNSNRICEVAIHPFTRQKRITLTGNVINNADVVIFLVTGENKSSVLKKVVVEKKKILPAEFIQPVDGKIIFFLDTESAKDLNEI